MYTLFKFLTFTFIFIISSYSSSCFAEEALETVPYVDLHRYVGKWYEIARTPNRWQKSCRVNTTATYSLKEDGTLHIVNECELEEDNPEKQKAEGSGWVSDKVTNSKLKISFVSIPLIQSLTSGDYWIILLADDYSYAVVSESTGTYFWILSRTPYLSEPVYQKILKEIEAKRPGIDLNTIIKTPQFSRNQIGSPPVHHDPQNSPK